MQNSIKACEDRSLSRIFNGEEANIWRFTYAVSLQVPKNDDSDQYIHRCGATLIARNLILTAAHCVWLEQIGGDTDFREIDSYQGNISKPLYAAIAPDCRHEQGWERIRVVRFYFPPSYWGVRPTERGQDIAVLVMERGVREDMYPVIMQLSEVDTYDNLEVLTIGWGAQYEYETIDQQEYASHLAPLKSADFKILECEDSILSQMGREEDSLEDFEKSMLCAISANEENDQDICPGDSGGPLLSMHPSDPSQDIQIAVSMWAPNLACTGSSRKSSVFTKISPWMKSIQKIMSVESGGKFKSIQIQDEVPYMVPDFEQVKMQAVFLPSNTFYQEDATYEVQRAAYVLQSSIANQSSLAYAEADTYGQAYVLQPSLTSQMSNADTDSDANVEASKIDLHQYGFSNYSHDYIYTNYEVLNLEPQTESVNDDYSIISSLGVNPILSPQQDITYETQTQNQQQQILDNDISTVNSTYEVDLPQVIGYVQENEEQKSQAGMYQWSDQFQVGLWLEQMGFLQSPETQEQDINNGYNVIGQIP